MNMSDYERMSKPLKPCPFCGGEALMKVYHHVPKGYDYTPTCIDKSCAGRLTKRWTDINLAVNAWNKRTETSAQEPKTGHWIDDEFGSKCSCCGIHTHLDKFDRPMKFKYCSMCGARMDLLEEPESEG